MATSPTSLANKVDELSTRLAKITTEAQRISQSRDAMKIAIERIANRINALGPKIKKITDAKKKCDKATGPEKEERQGRQLWAGRSDGFFGPRRTWGGGRES